MSLQGNARHRQDIQVEPALPELLWIPTGILVRIDAIGQGLTTLVAKDVQVMPFHIEARSCPPPPPPSRPPPASIRRL